MDAEAAALSAAEAAGPRSRFERLYHQHAQDAARLAYLLTGDRELARDLVQDAFVRIAGRFRDLRDETAFLPYLRTTIVNLARLHFRRRGVERRWLARQQPPASVLQPDVAGRHEIVQALLGLPERQRVAIVLRHYLDLPEQEVAEVMRCPLGTVKSLTARGLDALRTSMRGDEDARG